MLKQILKVIAAAPIVLSLILAAEAWPGVHATAGSASSASSFELAQGGSR